MFDKERREKKEKRRERLENRRIFKASASRRSLGRWLSYQSRLPRGGPSSSSSSSTDGRRFVDEPSRRGNRRNERGPHGRRRRWETTTITTITTSRRMKTGTSRTWGRGVWRRVHRHGPAPAEAQVAHGRRKHDAGRQHERDEDDLEDELGRDDAVVGAPVGGRRGVCCCRLGHVVQDLVAVSFFFVGMRSIDVLYLFYVVVVVGPVRSRFCFPRSHSRR